MTLYPDQETQLHCTRCSTCVNS